ncbi:FAD-dependent oxidoreductase [Pelagibacterium halotolerans]|uniref:Sarcosine oxidase alpha subunit n=1 Tax=Pelagibacterium halotolerans (strain DSM 22347 / JCM 15775 / CGMCC 1.7692 / B2) TaxID=1082931 RepID=G4RE25_PELHB|nr:FAD-dependent oxidoreductase [Pelagibacterium halotolerans]AEQ50819.1 sarcosine oxidase alpha subunit [Pelagibacterium halotolerans B2]QJR19265.1 FAD-dependent oxidoreductase [Pelagibacterium halotolerans]SDZ96946.1 sarcosine oxidase subunit alpha [Pelagibacterium halotolerans]
MNEKARLGGTLPPEFARPVIDSSRPVQFRLNGRSFAGVEGDTVLSALLANGIDSAGRFDGTVIALDEYSAPPIALEGNEGRPDLAMPMAICPAVDGASFVSVGPAPAVAQTFAARLMPRAKDTLGLTYKTGSAEPGGWIDAEATRRITADVAVVGGGVAGLSAALAAARKGLRVCLVEKEATLGGMSEFFGKAEGEPAPDETIGALASQIGESGLITLLLGTLAFDLSGGTIEAIRVLRTGTLPQPERIAIKADTIVLATGMVGRMPLFPGNRLPGVLEAGWAWRLAARYNIWPGTSAHIHSTTNAGYRMALLGAAGGKTIARASDPRIDPQTRFIEFCKAYGYRLGWGVTIGSVTPARRTGLAVRLADVETGAPGEEVISCDRLIVSGGWQPDLDLWLKASGPVEWDGVSQTLVARDGLEGVVLAGSVAGYLSLGGCVEHGKAALETALDGRERPVADPRIDPIFDTPDGPLLVSAPKGQEDAAFTAPGASRTLPAPAPDGWGRLIGLSSKPAPSAPTGPLGPLDVVGEIVAQRLDPGLAPGLCAERCVVPRSLRATADAAPAAVHVPEDIPLYLEGRFGAEQQQWTLIPGERRRFDPGCLVFANTDHRSPLDAVGVVLAGHGGEIGALLRHMSMKSGDTVYIRDGLTTVPARLGKQA